MKKLFALFLTAALVLSVFSGVVADEKTYDLKGATVKVRLWDPLVNPYDEATAEVDKELWLPIYEAAKAKYNCDFSFFTSTVEWDDMPSEFAMSVVAGQPVWHITNNLSAMWLLQLNMSNSLQDISAAMPILPIPEDFKESKYGYLTSYIGTEGLVFNRKMISDAGMEYDPGEMFQMGKWSYDDFFTYMTELQSKLPEGTYAFFIDPNYWQIFACTANGTMTVDGDYKVQIGTDAFIETTEFLQKMVAAGLCRPANVSAEGVSDYWGTPGATFDAGVEVAMTHRATWQMGGLTTNGLDWGFVPYPWGPQVTLGTEGDYTSLSENYRAGNYDSGVTGVQLAGAENDFPGVDKAELTEALTALSYELFVNPDLKAEMAARVDGTYVEEPSVGNFSDELSVELYNWLCTRTIYNPLATLYNAHIGLFTYNGEQHELSDLVRVVIDNNLSPRAAYEGFAPEIEAAIKDAGLAK